MIKKQMMRRMNMKKRRKWMMKRRKRLSQRARREKRSLHSLCVLVIVTVNPVVVLVVSLGTVVVSSVFVVSFCFVLPHPDDHPAPFAVAERGYESLCGPCT